MNLAGHSPPKRRVIMGKKKAEHQEQPTIWDIPMTFGRSSTRFWTNTIRPNARGIDGSISGVSCMA
jgi:hypothetical protein